MGPPRVCLIYGIDEWLFLWPHGGGCWRRPTPPSSSMVVFFCVLVLPCGPCARVIYSDRSLQAFTHLYGWDIIGRAKQDNADDGNFWSRQQRPTYEKLYKNMLGIRDAMSKWIRLWVLFRANAFLQEVTFISIIARMCNVQIDNVAGRKNVNFFKYTNQIYLPIYFYYLLAYLLIGPQRRILYCN